MISTNLRSSFACAMILAAAVTCSVRAQPSGFPGDGIPDLYFYPYLIDSTEVLPVLGHKHANRLDMLSIGGPAQVHLTLPRVADRQFRGGRDRG